MGTVAFIEEHGEVNLGLGMPAGIFTVIAAGNYLYITEPCYMIRIFFLHALKNCLLQELVSTQAEVGADIKSQAVDPPSASWDLLLPWEPPLAACGARRLVYTEPSLL